MINIYEKITTRIIEQLEQGVIPWKKPWKLTGINIKNATDLKKVAFNRITKTAYSPLNQMLLSKAGEYASFKQWKDLGGSIKKGAKAEMVVFWKLFDFVDKENSTNEEVVIKQIPYLKYLPVFHIDDIDGVEPLKLDDDTTIIPSIQLNEQAENIISNYLERENIKLIFGGDSAFYSPHSDYINLPNKYQFGKNTAEYYSTAFHEITHSTGAKNRLARLNSNAFFGNEEYSKEELVAEIGASAMLNILDIETKSSFNNSVAYIQSWIKALKNDNKLIVSASTKAEQAVKYIFNGKTQEVVE